MPALKLSILTNMVAPYRVPFFRALAADQRVAQLRILVCVEREADRKWEVKNDSAYQVEVLPGYTLDLKRGSDGRRILHFRFGIFWELVRHRPDCLVIGDASWTSYLAALACRLLLVKYIVWNEITTTSQVSAGFVANLRRWMYRGADNLVASCQMAKDYLLNNGISENKISIVNNAIDNKFFLDQRHQLESKRAEFRTELGVDKNAHCFIYVGQLISRKRVLETIKLMAMAASVRPIHLLVAGTGPLEAQMHTMAQNLGFTTITFCGYAGPEKLSQLYVASDSLIILSKDEPWGMVVNEAAIFGLKVVATKSVAAAVELKNTHNSRVTIINEFNRENIINTLDNNDRSVIFFSTPEDMAKGFLRCL